MLSLLRAKDIERLLRIVNEKRRRKGKDLVAPIENQQKRNTLAEEILKAMVQRQVLLRERKLAEHLRAILIRYVPGTPRCFAAERKLSGIAELLDLNPHETDIVSLLYCYGQYDAFGQLCIACKLPAFLKLLSVALVCPMRELRRLLAHKERLLTSGVVSDIDPDRSPAIRLNDEVAAHLAGIADIPLAERYCTKATGRTLDVKRFNMCPRSIGIAQKLLSRHGQCHLLLHGAPGTGKTEFAKSIIASTGKQPFFVQHGDSRGFGGEACSDRKMALQVALACVPRDTGILVVDEADDLLNTRTYIFGLDKAVDKGWLNMFMDRCDRQIVWITNETTYMEESTQRRFAYSIHFKPFTRHEREDIWKVLLKRHPLRKHIPVTVVRDLAGRYPVNAAGIASALDTLKTVVTGAPDDSTVQSILRELLDRHLHAIGKRKTKSLNTITAHYDVGALNVDIHPSRIVRALRAMQGVRRDQGTLDGGGSMNLLFWGAPGTGKTEYAKFLAQRLSADLLVKRASDLLNMWVGGTESNIRAAFDEAARDRAILFLDEADSLFIDREAAKQSWETSQTNELLTQMENFNGILICCTNLLEHLDHAVARRFVWKVHFRPLTPEGRVALYRKYFATGLPLPAALIDRVAAIDDLTPGDIKVVWQKYRHAAPEDRQHAQIVQELSAEVAYKQGHRRAIGF